MVAHSFGLSPWWGACSVEGRCKDDRHGCDDERRPARRGTRAGLALVPGDAGMARVCVKGRAQFVKFLSVVLLEVLPEKCVRFSG
jgi:hypothetical protein